MAEHRLRASTTAPAGRRTVGAWLGERIARFLSRRRHVHGTSAPVDLQRLGRCVRAGDVVLVEGDTRFSTGIKYLTQSTWSHAALCVGDALGDAARAGFVEADVVDGVRVVGLEAFAGLHVRICRPVGLTASVPIH